MQTRLLFLVVLIWGIFELFWGPGLYKPSKAGLGQTSTPPSPLSPLPGMSP